MTMRQMFCAILFLFTGLLLPQLAKAACTMSTVNANMGTVDSISLYKTQQRVSTNNSFICPGGIFSFITVSNTVTALANSTNNFKLVNAASGLSVPYAIYTNSNYTSGLLLQGQQSSTNFFNLFSIFTPNQGNFGLYYQIPPGANVPVGTYQDSVQVKWSWHICTVGFVLCLLFEDGSATTTIQVNLVVTKACLVDSAPNVNFGTQGVVASFSPVTQSITLTCTVQQPYRTYLTNGDHYAAPWKRMALNGQYLQYNIYQGNTNTAWDSSNQVAGTGTGLSQNLSYTARVNTAQPELPAGTYTDNVSITIEY